MRTVVVAVRACAELQEGFELSPDGTRVDPDFVEHALSDWDGAAIDAATQLGDHVVAVSVGGSEAEEALRAALALGAAHAVRLEPTDDAEDPLVVARLLAAFLARSKPDLVLCGVQSGDHSGSAVPAAVAGYLGWPRAAVAKQIEESPSGDVVAVARELEGGVVEVSALQLPAVVSVQTGTYEHKYPSFMAKRKAGTYELETVTTQELELDRAELNGVRAARTVQLSAPKQSTRGEALTGSASDIANRILSIINERLQ